MSSIFVALIRGKCRTKLTKLKVLYHEFVRNSLAIYGSLNHNNFMTTKKGFTLLEVLIVISIISVLAMLGVNNYASIQQNARNIQRKSDLKEIKAALELYRNEKGTYPSTVNRAGCPATAIVGDGDWCGLCSAYNTNNNLQTIDTDGTSTATDTGDTGYIPDIAPVFMQELPKDPRNAVANGSSSYPACRTYGGFNCYLYNSNGTDYKIIAHCSPEGTMNANDPFYDPRRPTHAWQISSSSISLQW